MVWSHGYAGSSPVFPTKKIDMELSYDLQAKGTRIIFDAARERRKVLNEMIGIVESFNYSEIDLPIIESADVYVNKAGEEILKQMYVFPDKANRSLCLRPEGTATVQLLADKYWRTQKDVKLWYFTRCYRYEQPQAGRYREFFQFGVEVINPRNEMKDEMLQLAKLLVETKTKNYVVNKSVQRGLSYYTENGFEISCESLGAQKQICGGGKYKQGIGFAIGFDRLMLT